MSDDRVSDYLAARTEQWYRDQLAFVAARFGELNRIWDEADEREWLRRNGFAA